MTNLEKSILEKCDVDSDGYIVSRFDSQMKAYELGREQMLSEVLEYLKSIPDDAGWYYADKVRAKFKGIEASEGKGKE